MKNEIVITMTPVAIKRNVDWEMNGRKGQSASIHATVGTDLIKFKADNSKVAELDIIEKSLNKPLKIICQVRPGNNLVASLVVVGVETK